MRVLFSIISPAGLSELHCKARSMAQALSPMPFSFCGADPRSARGSQPRSSDVVAISESRARRPAQVEDLPHNKMTLGSQPVASRPVSANPLRARGRMPRRVSAGQTRVPAPSTAAVVPYPSHRRSTSALFLLPNAMQFATA